jgi:3-isopropylmalate dehydratase small subunit
VWALRGAGIRVIIAKSYAFTHKRNLINEGFPFLVVCEEAFYRIAEDGRELEIDLGRDSVRDVVTGQLFRAEPTPAIARNLRVADGLVAAIRRCGSNVLSTLLR